jgi:hypothetical protein
MVTGRHFWFMGSKRARLLDRDTNLPFGVWTKVLPDPRLAKPVVDRVTYKAWRTDPTCPR